MKLGVLFSGGKDSTYACYIAKKQGNKVSCLITLESENKDSFMFHTPTIKLTKKQARLMGIPIITNKTNGEREKELEDLEKSIKLAIEKYKIEGIVTGAVESVYQASRIQKICNKLKIECFNLLWQKDQIELLNELLKNKFEVIISSVAAEGLDITWLGRRLDQKMIEDLKILNKKFGVSPSFEGGEAESLVLDCPLFKKRIKIGRFKKIWNGNSGRLELEEQY